MNKKMLVMLVIAIGIGLIGFITYKLVSAPKIAVQETEELGSENTSYPENTSVDVTVERSSAKDNTIVLSIGALEKKYADIAYEITYETQGVIQGVNSGSKPIELNDQEEFSREVYLGTCSKNVCKPHPGVTSVSVALEFTDLSGNKTQFSKDYDL